MTSKKANLFVVGAMRAGTTSFLELLSKHPEIYVSPIKEPHFFVETLPEAIFEPLPSNHLKMYFQKEFVKPIHRAYVKNLKDYQKLFENATHQKHLAEGSVSYLHFPGAAAAIQQYNPEAKIIILTRDPLQRALSHYRMNVGLFREKRSFEAVMKAEIEAYNNKHLPWHSYLNMSFYNTPISHYQHNFENVLVLSFEDLVSKPKEIFAELSTFLNISSFKTPRFPNLNKSKQLRFRNYFGVLYSMERMPILSSIMRGIVKIWAKRIFLSGKKETINISDELRKELVAIFQKEC